MIINSNMANSSDSPDELSKDYPDEVVKDLHDWLENTTFNIKDLMNYTNISDYLSPYYDEYECTYEEYINDECMYTPCDMDHVAYDDTYRLYMHILLPIICLIGIVGIILTVIVLSRKSMSTSTNCYLTSLAITDLCFLVFMGIKVFEIGLSREGHYLYMTIGNYIHIFLDIFLLASVWLTVMLGVERYIAICHPLRAMSICTVKRARFIIVAIFMLSTACRVPNFFRYRIITFSDECLDKEVVYYEFTELGKDQTFRKVYAWTFNCWLCAVLPFSTLLFLNGCLIREIHRSTNYLRYHLAIDSNVQTIITSEEVKITMMLISVIIVFFICQAPYVILAAVKSILMDQLFAHFHILTYITVLLLALRSSFNFVLYCWFSEKFWYTFKRTFCTPACRILGQQRWMSTRVTGNNSEHGHSNNNPGQDVPLSCSRLTNGQASTIKEIHSNEEDALSNEV